MKVYVKWDKRFQDTVNSGVDTRLYFMNLKKMGIKIWITRHSTTYNCNDEDSVAIIFNCNGVVAQIPNKLAECVTRDVYINKKLSAV